MEKLRDVLELFFIDENVMNDFKRRVVNSRLTTEEFGMVAAEFMPKFQKQEPLPLTDNYLRETRAPE